MGLLNRLGFGGLDLSAFSEDEPRVQEKKK